MYHTDLTHIPVLQRTCTRLKLELRHLAAELLVNQMALLTYDAPAINSRFKAILVIILREESCILLR